MIAPKFRNVNYPSSLSVIMLYVMIVYLRSVAKADELNFWTFKIHPWFFYIQCFKTSRANFSSNHRSYYTKFSEPLFSGQRQPISKRTTPGKPSRYGLLEISFWVRLLEVQWSKKPGHLGTLEVLWTSYIILNHSLALLIVETSKAYF